MRNTPGKQSTFSAVALSSVVGTLLYHRMSLIPTSIFSEPINVYNLVAQDEGTCDGKLASSYFRQDFTLIEGVHPLFR